VIPLRDDNPHFLTPFVTIGLIVLNLVAWVAVQGFGTEPALTRSICTLGLIPGELLGLLPEGRTPQGAVCGAIDEPLWLTLVSSMFLHGGLGHILGNMWFLWVFGNNVEDSMGHTRFFAFYLLCGVMAAVAQIIASPASPVPMVGASGAIGGVMGAYVVLYPRVPVHMIGFIGIPIFFAVPAIWMLGYWFVVQLLSGVFSVGDSTGGVAFWAHVGGFVAGALLIGVFQDRSLVRRHPYHGWSDRSNAARGWGRI